MEVQLIQEGCLLRSKECTSDLQDGPLRSCLDTKMVF